ncbi:MAG: thiamine phosphate synthase [Mycoplasmatales bacterium]
MASKYGVYLISDPKYSEEQMTKAINSGIKYFQLRLKTTTTKQFLQIAQKYQQICQRANVKFIVNDRLDIALALQSDGIHIGQDDLDIQTCRMLYPQAIIGVSVSTVKEAQIAQSAGADYIGVGAMFTSKTKKDAKHVELKILEEIKKVVNIDIVCIGGINSDNVGLLKNKCSGIAVCESILGAKDPQEAIIKLEQIWEN